MAGFSLVRTLLAFIFISTFSTAAWANSVSIGWNANSESDLTGYNVYRSSSSGSGYARINSSLIQTTSYQDYNVTAGQTCYYVVTAMNTRGQESRYSNEVKAVVGCGYTISPTSRQHASTSGTGSISVTTSSGCPWNAKSSASWISITSGSSGQGSGTVTYSVSANTSSSTRMGSITVQDQSFTVSQSGISTTSEC
jgi:fibronectin type 3 domain-containing protein